MSLGKGVLCTALSIGAALATLAAPAGARTRGHESFRGQIIAPAASGHRHVTSSIIVGQGVFAGVGKIVEVANRQGDPANVSRDDLVFPAGTMHLLNTNHAPRFSIDHKTCALTAVIKQTNRIQGGTGKFRHASGRFTGVVRAWGVAARKSDGSCDLNADVLLDADAFVAHGRLSF
jgi:hypothetical protein